MDEQPDKVPGGPEANRASITVNTRGRSMKILAWVGSGGGGLSFCCMNMVKPMISGQMPICRKLGGVQWINPNRLKMVVGSGADRSWIQPKNGLWRISIVTKSVL